MRFEVFFQGVARPSSIRSPKCMTVFCAGEMAVKLKPEELSPLAAAIVERLVPILQNMNSMPRSIVENRYGHDSSHAVHPVRTSWNASHHHWR